MLKKEDIKDACRIKKLQETEKTGSVKDVNYQSKIVRMKRAVFDE